MRFIADGIDIPNELLWAHDEGRVVFFCGAGVSMGKGRLPSFTGLTEQVLKELRATDDDEAQRLFNEIKRLEGHPDLDGLVTADRVFALMAKSFSPHDIGRSVASALKPADDFDLSAHKAMLQLSRLPSGQTRLVTTNFDRLFEAADPKLNSHTRSSLPRIEYEEVNWGIVHLHGAVTQDYSGPTSDGFVLSSSEFGNAYLSAGWARDFVRQILDSYVAVFVGYRADDPPIRYLLEGLQIEGGSANDIYAFQSIEGANEHEQWESKGVTPILYSKTDEGSHERLWNSLKAWGVRAKDPEKWRRQALRLARKKPQDLEAHERGIVAHLVSSPTGAKAFSGTTPKPPAEWLCVFDPRIRYGEPKPLDGPFSDSDVIDPFSQYALDSDPLPIEPNEEFAPRQARMPREVWSGLDPILADRLSLEDHQVPSLRGMRSSSAAQLPIRLWHMATWMADVADDPACVWWAGQQERIHDNLLDRLSFKFHGEPNTKLERLIRGSWQEVIEYHELVEPDAHDRFSLRREIGRSGWHPSTIRAYAEYWTPKLARSSIWNAPVPPDKRSAHKRRLVSFEPHYDEHLRASIDVPDEHLHTVLRRLSIGVETICDLENRYRSRGQDFCSIELDEDPIGRSSGRSYRLSGHILHFVGLFRRLAALDPNAAYGLLRLWPDTDTIFIRLKVWALGNLDIAPASAYAAKLMELDVDAFWPFRGNRDLMLGLARRWADFSESERKAIETRIKKGPRKYRTMSKEDHVRSSAHARLSRLYWLHRQSCEFSFDLDTYAKKLRTSAPEWKEEWADKAAETHDGRGGMVRTNADWSALRDISPAELINKCAEQEGRNRDFLTEDRPFVGISEDAPLRALVALKLASKPGADVSRYWTTFLGRETRADDPIRLKVLIAGRLAQLDSELFAEIAHASTRWFETNGYDVQGRSQDCFEKLWNKFLILFTDDSEAAQSAIVRKSARVDWTSEAINSPAGHLADFVMADPRVRGEIPKGSFPPDWLSRAEQLLALGGDSTCYALVTFCFDLNWFYFHAPVWTEKNLLFALNGPETSSEYDAFVAALMRTSNIPTDTLFKLLKPHLLKMVPKTAGSETQNVQTLSGFLLGGWNSKDDTETRYVTHKELSEALLNSTEEFRDQLLWHLKRWSKGDNWSEATLTLLRDVWPKHKKIRTRRISGRLFELAMDQGKHFVEVANLVAELVVPVNDSDIYLPSLRDPEGANALKYPEALLNLLFAILPDERRVWPYDIEEWLDAIIDADPGLKNDARYRELMSRFAKT